MGNGQTQAPALPADKQKEVDALNLHPREREMLTEVLTNSPTLGVQEALAMLKSAGM